MGPGRQWVRPEPPGEHSYTMCARWQASAFHRRKALFRLYQNLYTGAYPVQGAAPPLSPGYPPSFFVGSFLKCQVLLDAERENFIILKQDGQAFGIRPFLKGIDVHAVEQDTSLFRPVKAAQQFDKCGLARAVPAHNGQFLPFPYG